MTGSTAAAAQDGGAEQDGGECASIFKFLNASLLYLLTFVREGHNHDIFIDAIKLFI
jgi:hypothetical protein